MGLVNFEVITSGFFDSAVKYGIDKAAPYRFVYDYEIEYYVQCQGYAHINSEQHPMKPGNIIVAKPGDVRSSALPIQCFFIHIRVQDGLVKEYLDSLPPVIETPQGSEYVELFQSILDHFVSGKIESDVKVAAETMQILSRLRESQVTSARQALSVNTDQIIEMAQSYIDSHYTEELSIDDLALYCNVSPSYLHKLFMRVLKESPHQVILKRRLAAAKAMIVNDNLTMSDIAIRSGFNSQAYFSDCFKRVIGMSPVDYRKYAAHQA